MWACAINFYNFQIRELNDRKKFLFMFINWSVLHDYLMKIGLNIACSMMSSLYSYLVIGSFYPSLIKMHFTDLFYMKWLLYIYRLLWTDKYWLIPNDFLKTKFDKIKSNDYSPWIDWNWMYIHVLWCRNESASSNYLKSFPKSNIILKFDCKAGMIQLSRIFDDYLHCWLLTVWTQNEMKSWAKVTR